MGTRADFYIVEGSTYEWLGSIAYDGYPEGIPLGLLKASEPEEFRVEVHKLIRQEKGTHPNQGWPWPWESSDTTDFSYLLWKFGEHWKVRASCFGGALFDPINGEPPEQPDFPKMDTDTAAKAGDPRSGVMVFEV